MKAFIPALVAVMAFVVGCGKSRNAAIEHKTKYPVLTVEILQGIADKDVEMAVLDYVYGKIGKDYEHEARIVKTLPKAVQMIYSTSLVDAEVNNGGFNQYYWNSSGQFRDDAVEGFKMIGATEHEKLMMEANKLYEAREQTMEKQKAKGTIEAFSDSYKDNPWNQLDSKFYDLKEDVTALRLKYIREHPQLFVSQ